MKIDVDDPQPFFRSSVYSVEEYAKKNPPKRVRKPSTLPKTFTPAELEALFDRNRRYPRERAAMTFLRETGLRSAEALSITAQEARSWRAPRRWRRFRPPVVVVTGKGSKERVVLISGDAVKAAHLLAAQRSGSMFPWSARGLRYALAEAGKRAGVEHVHPHRFRHQCITEWAESGTPLEVAADMAGHSSTNTTRIYYTSSVSRRIDANRRRAKWRRRRVRS